MNPADETAIESVFRLVNREVWIVTAGHEQHRAGLVATWVLQASIAVSYTHLTLPTILLV